MEIFFAGFVIAALACLVLLFVVPVLAVAGGALVLVLGLLAQLYDAIEAGVRRWRRS